MVMARTTGMVVTAVMAGRAFMVVNVMFVVMDGGDSCDNG
jgi:hypothetical protein